MTIKQFADKYKIPYNIAYEATFDVKRKDTKERENDLVENDLYKAVIGVMKQNRDKAMKRANRWDDMIQGVKKIHES